MKTLLKIQVIGGFVAVLALTTSAIFFNRFTTAIVAFSAIGFVALVELVKGEVSRWSK